METFHAEYKTRIAGRMYLMFLLVFVPIFSWGIHTFIQHQPLPVPAAFIYICVSVPIALGFFYAISLMLNKRLQRWIISEEEIIYESASSALGNSFRIPISQFRRVEIDGDSDFAFCERVDGQRQKFHIGHSGGWKFYNLLKRKQQTKG